MEGYEAAVRRAGRRHGGSWRPAEDGRAGDARGSRPFLETFGGRAHRGRQAIDPLGRRFWPLDSADRDALDALFDTEPLRALATALRGRDDDAEVRVMDAAY